MPAYVTLDKQVLYFKAYMKQTVHESASERYRVRYFNVYYYLEDDTIAISEPEIENSGMPHGAFLARAQLVADGEAVHWTKLNVGSNLMVYGKALRLYATNESTKKFLEREGIVVGEPEDAPLDPYAESRAVTDRPQVLHNTPSDFDKLKQFLVLDRKVLRFYCTWEDPSSAGETLKAEVFYFLVDDSVEVREVHSANDGRDPFPVLLRRGKVPRNPRSLPIEFPTSVLEVSSEEVDEYVNPADFAIGKSVHIFGRDYFVYDLDEFTRDFYRRNFNEIDFTPIDVSTRPPTAPQAEIPPYNGIGSAEDSYLSCVTIAPKAPLGQKSLLQLLKHDNSLLRFLAVLDPETHEGEEGRSFILSFRLADDMVSIFEPPVANSGIQGGTILSFQLVQRPGCNPDKPEYLKQGDFAIGAKIEIFKLTYLITGCDKAVLSYMEKHPEEFTPASLESTRSYFGK